jgi:hypothetical protein
VRLEGIEERVACGDGRECEGRRDQGQRGHGSVAIWELLLLIRSWDETGEDGQFARDVGAV